MKNTKVTSKLFALIIFAIILVGGSSVVKLFEQSNHEVKNQKLASSNEERQEIDIERIKANILMPNRYLELEIEPEVKVKEEVKPKIVYDGLTKEELDNKLNNVLHSTLSGTGSSFSNYALELGVDPYLAVAIVLQETGCYWNCSSMVNQCYNVGGMKGVGDYSCWGSSYAGYNNLDEGIRVYVYNLYNNFVSRGLTTAELMNPSYAEDTLWASRVNNYIGIIRNS